MSRRKRLKTDKETRRILEQASGFRYVADIIRSARALADELDLEDDTDIYAARFLAGDKQED